MSDVTLREYIDRRFEDQEKAVQAALVAVKEEGRKTEIAAEKRFELLNELRGDVATKTQLEALTKVVEDLKTSRDTGTGRSGGLNAGWGYLLGAIGLISLLIGIGSRFIK